MFGDKGSPDWPEFEAAPRADMYLELIARAALAEQEAWRLTKNARREAWYSFVNDAFRRASGPVYRWIRQGPRVAPAQPVLAAPFSPGPQGSLDRMDEFWWGLWGRPLGPPQSVYRWLRHVLHLPRPPPLRPITPARIRAVLV